VPGVRTHRRIAAIAAATLSVAVAVAFAVAASPAAPGRPPEDAAMGRDGARMHLVPSGPFLQGSESGARDERPARRVQVDAFWIDEREVTNRLYATFVVAAGHRKPKFSDHAVLGAPEHPVVGVTWDDATCYCRWAGRRLPTEAEWEKAARGSDGRMYPWGETKPGAAPALGNFGPVPRRDGAAAGDGHELTAPVGSFPAGASPYGILDMAGNAYEWCADWYAPDAYSRSPGANPQGPGGGASVLVRGGSFRNTGYNLRCARRTRIDPGVALDRIGFRCAVSASAAEGVRPIR
jgi:formylglycine-generating enzyme required for sulfatase activity